MITNRGDMVCYGSIEKRDSTYYGIIGKTEVLLDPSEVRAVFIEDRYFSRRNRHLSSRDRSLSRRKIDNRLLLMEFVVDVICYH